MKKSIQKIKKNTSDLLTRIQESWNHSDKEYCFKLRKSTPERINAVIKAQIGATKYWF